MDTTTINKALCKLTLTDEAGNRVEVVVSADAHISEWMEAYRRILKFVGFHHNNISEYLGD